MTLEENIKIILEYHFDIAKDEIIEAATKRIMEQIERQNPVVNIKQYLKETNSVLLTEQCYKYLKEKADVIEKLEDINDNKQCGNCKFCVPSSSIFDSGVGYCTKTDEGIRVSLGSYCCDDYEEGETNDTT